MSLEILNQSARLLDPIMLLRYLEFAEKKGLKVSNARAKLAAKVVNDEAGIAALREKLGDTFDRYFAEVDGEISCSKVDRLNMGTLDDVNSETIATLVALAGKYHAADKCASAAEILRFAYDAIKSQSINCDWEKIQWGVLATSIISKKADNFYIFSDLAKKTKEHDNVIGRQMLMFWAPLMAFEGGKMSRLFHTFSSDVHERAFLSLVEVAHPFYVRYIILSALGERTINNSKSNSFIIDLLKIVSYSDDITAFAKALWEDYDFIAAGAMLPKLEEAIDADFFLAGGKDKILKEARRTILDGYLRTHKRTHLEALGKIVGIPAAEAETIVVELMRFSTISAKIDTVSMIVTVMPSAVDVHQKILDDLKTAHRQQVFAVNN